MFTTGELATRTRLYIKRTPWLYRSAKRLTGRGAADHLCDRHSELCIEGYPSSGNSFSFAILRLADPQLRIAHHCHSVANLAIALSYGIPAVCLIRDPADAIASRLARFDGDVRASIAEYVDFYAFAATRRERLTIVTFEEATRQSARFLARLESECGLRFEVTDFAALERCARAYMTRWSAHNGDPQKVSLPVAGREREKARLYEAIRATPGFAEADSLWRLLSGRYNGTGADTVSGQISRYHVPA